MKFYTFIIVIYCLIDDWLADQPRYRQRGPQSTLSDKEQKRQEESSWRFCSFAALA